MRFTISLILKVDSPTNLTVFSSSEIESSTLFIKNHLPYNNINKICYQICYNFFYIKKTTEYFLWSSNWLRPTLPGPCGPSTIGDEELNCCVRDGNRCILFSIIAILVVSAFVDFYLSTRLILTNSYHFVNI